MRCEAVTEQGQRCKRTGRTMIGHSWFCLPHARLGWVGYINGVRQRKKLLPPEALGYKRLRVKS